MGRQPPVRAIDDLGPLGLDEDAVAVWRAMLRDPEASAEAQRGACGVDESAYISSLHKLLDAGCIGHDPSCASGYAPVDPAVAIDAKARELERQLSETAARLAAVRLAIPVLADDFRHGRDLRKRLPGCELVVGLAEIQRRINAACVSCRTQQRSLDNVTTPSGLLEILESEIETLGRGVRDRTIFATPLLSDPVRHSAVEAMHAYGAEVRTLPDVPTRMLILDEFLAVLPVDPARTGEAALFIHEPSIIGVLIYLFDRLWEDANPVFSTLTNEAPTHRQVRILELMAAGAKDDAIARALGLGVRTVGRELAELKVHLMAGSRAEMVGAAMRRGWL